MFSRKQKTIKARLGKESYLKVYQGRFMYLSLSRRDYNQSRDFDLLIDDIRRATGYKIVKLTDDTVAFKAGRHVIELTTDDFHKAFTEEIFIKA